MKVLDFLVHSSIYLAFCSALLVYACCLLLNVEPKFEFLIVMFLTIYSIYNFSRITDKKEDEINVPERVSTFMKYEKYIKPTIPISYVGAIFLGLYIGGFVLVLVILLFLVFFLLYTFRWIPKFISKYQRLKDIIVVKSIIVSFAWTWIVVFIPFFYFSIEATIQFFVVFAFIFWRMFVTVVFFDLKDIKGDATVGTKTIPVVFGAKNTLIMLSVINALLAIFIFWATLQGWLPKLAHVVNFGVAAYSYIYIYLCDKIKNVTLLYGIIVDGELMVIGVLAFIGSLMF